MASSMMVSSVGSRFFYSPTSEALNRKHRFPTSLLVPSPTSSARRGSVRADAINPSIRKEEEKVVDSVQVTELSKPLTAYCRCWRSGTFPLCDGSHVKHNKETGDNVGPLLLKKPKE